MNEGTAYAFFVSLSLMLLFVAVIIGRPAHLRKRQERAQHAAVHAATKIVSSAVTTASPDQNERVMIMHQVPFDEPRDQGAPLIHQESAESPQLAHSQESTFLADLTRKAQRDKVVFSQVEAKKLWQLQQRLQRLVGRESEAGE